MRIKLKLSEHQSPSIRVDKWDDMLRNSIQNVFICDDGINLKI